MCAGDRHINVQNMFLHKWNMLGNKFGEMLIKLEDNRAQDFLKILRSHVKAQALAKTPLNSKELLFEGITKTDLHHTN